MMINLWNRTKTAFTQPHATARILTALWLALALPAHLQAAGPAPVNLGTTANFVILAGAAITTTGGGIINGNIGASPIAGSAIGINCAQINGTIYAVDASGPPCAVVDATRLATAKNDLTIAFNDAAGRTPVPTGTFLNPNGGNLGGMNLVPGLYKITTTTYITGSPSGSDLTLTGGPNDVWIFQCGQDLQVAGGVHVILAGGAQAANVYWQVGTSAVIGTFADFNGNILADQAITMNTGSTMVGRALAFAAGVTFNGTGAVVPISVGPAIAVQQPAGTNLVNGAGTNNFGSLATGTNLSRTFIITNTGTADLTVSGVTIDGSDAASFSVTANPAALVSPNSSTTFTVRFAPVSPGVKTAALHIANNDISNNLFNIAISGTGTNAAPTPAPVIVVQQPAGTNLVNGAGTNNFGSVTTGTNLSQTFTITNTGNATLTISGVSLDGPDAAAFSVTANPSASVSPNGSTTFTVRFSPSSSGMKTAALHIANNDSSNNPFNIAITGTGTNLPTAPAIAVQQPTGTTLANGVGTDNFGAVAVNASLSQTFTITNTGNANLTVTGISIDGPNAASFSVTASPASPVAPHGSTTFTVSFAPVSPGAVTAALHIASNDGGNNPFNIAITGTGTSPGTTAVIGVQQPAGTNLVNGVGTNNFGFVADGTTTSLTFTITNTGSANLTGVNITIDGLNATLFTVTASPTAQVNPNGSTTFTVSFAPVSTGVKTAVLHIASNDAGNNPFNITLGGMGIDSAIVVATNITVIATSSIKVYPQTGLFTNSVRLTNTSPNTISAIRLFVLNLPADVKVYNASGSTAGGTPWLQYNFPLAPAATVDFAVEYYRANRQAFSTPDYVAQFLTNAATRTITNGSGIMITNILLSSGNVLIGFYATPGRSYAVQYSADMSNWRTVDPFIVAPANYVQWIDSGPPKTESLPAARYYRVFKLP